MEPRIEAAAGCDLEWLPSLALILLWVRVTDMLHFSPVHYTLAAGATWTVTVSCLTLAIFLLTGAVLRQLHSPVLEHLLFGHWCYHKATFTWMMAVSNCCLSNIVLGVQDVKPQGSNTDMLYLCCRLPEDPSYQHKQNCSVDWLLPISSTHTSWARCKFLSPTGGKHAIWACHQACISLRATLFAAQLLRVQWEEGKLLRAVCVFEWIRLCCFTCSDSCFSYWSCSMLFCWLNLFCQRL